MFKIHSKGKKQMSIPKEHVYITFITPWVVFIGILGFQSITFRCKTPCSCLININVPNIRHENPM